LKLPVEDIFRGGNSKPRNSHMQTMLRMIGFGDNAGSGFPTIVSAWDAEGWVKPELIEDTILNQVTLKLDMVKAESVVEESTAVPKSVEEDTDERVKMILDFCSIPRSRDEIMNHIGLVNREYFRKTVLKPLLEAGILEMTDKEHLKSKNQKYVAKQ